MAEKPDRPGERKSTWNWAYLIPILALLIPITAITNANVGDLVPVIVTVLILGGLWAGGRNLLAYRHQLRMDELRSERDIAALEAERLREAQRVLDLDDRIEELKGPETEPPQLA